MASTISRAADARDRRGKAAAAPHLSYFRPASRLRQKARVGIVEGGNSGIEPQ
jgi:hypothetical protein